MVAYDSTMNIAPAAGPNCIVFMCDEGYLFPTLVAARMARANAPSNADIVIFLDAREIDSERVALMEAASGASIRIVPESVVRLLDEQLPAGFFDRTHVSRATLYRLFIGDLLEASYRFILYLDGDIQIRRSLTPLLELDLPEGEVAAAPDWASVHCVANIDLPDHLRSYYVNIGLGPEHWTKYFNAGVMMATPQTWSAIGPAALDFLIANPEACRFYDQSALNHVCRDRVTTLSLRWNFLRGFMHSPAYPVIDPAIVHYAARPKPWDDVYSPWGWAEFSPYPDMARALEGSGVNWPRMSLSRRLAYKVKHLVPKRAFENPAYGAAIEKALLSCARGESLNQ